jgi:hypothetical protein
VVNKKQKKEIFKKKLKIAQNQTTLTNKKKNKTPQ